MSKYAAKGLGDQLRKARVTSGLSVANAAEVLRVTRQMLYNYEKGNSLPRLDVLTRAARAWGATFELGGCKVLPETTRTKSEQAALPVQLELAYQKERLYKGASVRIRQKGRKVFITMVLPNGARR
ncbi:MAG: helix-turn-helix transcriptional regulator [Terriglobia bacterium]